MTRSADSGPSPEIGIDRFTSPVARDVSSLEASS